MSSISKYTVTVNPSTQLKPSQIFFHECWLLFINNWYKLSSMLYCIKLLKIKYPIIFRNLQYVIIYTSFLSKIMFSCQFQESFHSLQFPVLSHLLVLLPTIIFYNDAHENIFLKFYFKIFHYPIDNCFSWWYIYEY